MSEQVQSTSKNKAPINSTTNRKRNDLPLDFSFKDLTDIIDLPNEEAREILPGKRPERAGEDEKYEGTIVKLNNNMIKDISGLPTALEELIFNPMDLTWIDLSCNELTAISEVLCAFKSLQILYLQGNLIKDIKEVDKLAGVPNLRKLNLHGNPMDKEKGYRLYCIKKLPQLQHFDCSLITKADKKTAETFKPEVKKKKKKKEDD